MLLIGPYRAQLSEPMKCGGGGGGEGGYFGNPATRTKIPSRKVRANLGEP